MPILPKWLRFRKKKPAVEKKPDAAPAELKKARGFLKIQGSSFRKKTYKGKKIGQYKKRYAERVRTLVRLESDFIAGKALPHEFFDSMAGRIARRAVNLLSQGEAASTQRNLLVTEEIARLGERVKDFERLENAASELEYYNIILDIQYNKQPK